MLGVLSGECILSSFHDGGEVTMWKFEHSVECRVNRDSTWKFWTNVDNWPVVDPSVESVKINGSVVAGTQGTTKPRDHDTVEWRLTEVEPPRRARIEIPAPGRP